MKKNIIIMIMIAFGFSLALAGDLKLPPITEKTLDNGLNVIIIENHELPIVAMQVVIKSGSSFNPAGKAGLADFTAGMLRKGTKTKNAVEISEAIDFVGGSLDASSNRDYTAASASVLLKHFDVGLSLLADIVQNPVFDTTEISRLRNQILSGIVQAKDDANSLVENGFNSMLFGAHPYGLPQEGTEATVNSITRDDIVKFYKDYYHPNNAMFIVAGDVKPDDIIKKANSAFKNWSKSDIPTVNFPSTEAPKGYKILLINKPDASQANIRFGHFGITRNSPDYYSLLLMNYILGSSFTSRLTEKVRVEGGLTYDIRTTNEWNKLPAAYYCNTFTENDSTLKAIKMAIEVIKNMRTAEVTDQEFNEAVNFWSGYYPMSLETPSRVASEIVKIKLYGLPVSYIQDFTANIKKVTKKDILAAAQKYIDPDNMDFCIVSKASDIQEALKTIGPVTVKSVDDK